MRNIAPQGVETRRFDCIRTSDLIYLFGREAVVAKPVLVGVGPVESVQFRSILPDLRPAKWPDSWDHCSRRSYYSCLHRSPSKKVGPRLTRDIRRDILLLRELNDYEDEVEYTYISLSERDACKM